MNLYSNSKHVIAVASIIVVGCNQTDSVKNESAIFDAFILKSVENSCLEKQFYFKSKEDNIREILKVRASAIDSINGLVIEKHLWSVNSCSINTFYVIKQGASILFVPYCDEFDLMKRHGKDTAHIKSNTSLQEFYDESIKKINIKSINNYNNSFLQSVFGNHTASENDIDILCNTEKSIYYRVYKNINSKRFKYYNTKYGYGAMCMWEVENKNNKLVFKIINPGLYKCISM